eukprot:3933603-Rhodomonas_salina.1
MPAQSRISCGIALRAICAFVSLAMAWAEASRAFCREGSVAASPTVMQCTDSRYSFTLSPRSHAAIVSGFHVSMISRSKRGRSTGGDTSARRASLYWAVVCASRGCSPMFCMSTSSTSGFPGANKG